MVFTMPDTDTDTDICVSVCVGQYEHFHTILYNPFLSVSVSVSINPIQLWSDAMQYGSQKTNSSAFWMSVDYIHLQGE